MLCIRELYRQDIAQTATFLAAQTGSSPQSLEARLSWLSENPASQPDIPLGIGAYQQANLCGTMIFIPSRFSDGRTVRTCVLSALFYVDERARGVGLPLFLKFRSLSAKYPLYAATANVASAPMWQRLGGIAIEGSDREFVRVHRWVPILQEVFHIRRVEKSAADVDLSIPTGTKVPLVPLQVSELAADTTSASQSRGFEMVRDPALLSWKLYAMGQKVYRFDSGSSSCFCVFQQNRRGYRQQVSSTEIIDLWGRVKAEDWTSFVGSIRRMFSPDVITFRGCSPVARLGFSTPGFLGRKFKTHTAWLMDPSQLLEGRFLYSPLAGE
jgi:hypothetical protein